MADSLTPVQPGDLITASLINQILQRLESLNTAVTALNNRTGPDFAGLQLGELAAGTHTLVGLGTGFESGGGIWLDGTALLSGEPGRGINLVILDPDLNVKHRRTYDTHGSSAQAEQLATDLNTLASRYDVVIAVTHDAYSLRLSPNARAALAAVGAAALGQATQTRDNAAFIGVVPANKSGVSFDFLTSVIPADAAGTGSAQLAGLPFAWGLYSQPLHRFLLGGASNKQSPVASPTPTVTIGPTATATIGPTLTATIGPTSTATIGPTLTATIGPTSTATIGPTLTATIGPTNTATIGPTLTATIGPTITGPIATGIFTITGPGGPQTLVGSFPSGMFGPGGGNIGGLVQPVVNVIPLSADEPVSAVRGIGPQRTDLLTNAGIHTVGELANASTDVLITNGFSENLAETLIAEARNVLRSP